MSVFLLRFQFLKFLDKFSKKYSNKQLNENLSSGSLVVACGQIEGKITDGQTDRHDEINSGFRNFVNITKNSLCHTIVCLSLFIY